MAGPEQFDFVAFGESLRGLPRQEQRDQVQAELARMHGMVVREPSLKFKQHIYLRRLERLGRFLAGEEVSMELTPTEIEAYALISSPPEPPPAAAPPAAHPSPAPSAPVAPAAAPLAAAAAAEAQAGGAERRRARRIQMRTRARVRRLSDGTAEVLEPVNVSRGGIAFRSSRLYVLHEKVTVNMHYRPNQPEGDLIESHGMIVRAVPESGVQFYSYGVKFLD
jgi:pyruvate/2-oxoglutarate dehydrogenase complex dihydrolipoamide acyltransferase (E2) component